MCECGVCQSCPNKGMGSLDGLCKVCDLGMHPNPSIPRQEISNRTAPVCFDCFRLMQWSNKRRMYYCYHCEKKY